MDKSEIMCRIENAVQDKSIQVQGRLLEARSIPHHSYTRDYMFDQFDLYLYSSTLTRSNAVQCG
jgi:hypothetical protein